MILIPLLLAADVGRIQGGWPYVVASYVLTWTVLLGYGVSLWLRRPRGPEESP